MATTRAALANSSTDSHKVVPEWIERNSQLFRAHHPANHHEHRSPRVTTIRSNYAATKSEANDDDNAAACMAPMLMSTAEDGVGWIEAPEGLQPASYYRDLSNHPNILATFLYTARRKAGFLPSVMGQQLSQEQWNDYINKCNAWLKELDAFSFYVRLISQNTMSLSNDSATSDTIVKTLSEYVLEAANYEVEDEAKKEVAQRMKTTFELAAEYMAEKNISTERMATVVSIQVSLQHEAFPPPGTIANPNVPISVTFTTLSNNVKDDTSSSTIQYGPATMHQFTYQLNSKNIIDYAEALSKGTTLLSTKDYCDYINGPLDEWANRIDTSKDPNN